MLPTGPVSCLSFGIVEKPWPLRGGEAYLSNAPSLIGWKRVFHSFIHVANIHDMDSTTAGNVHAPQLSLAGLDTGLSRVSPWWAGC